MSLKAKKLHKRRKRAEYEKRRLVKMGAAGKWRRNRFRTAKKLELLAAPRVPGMVDVMVQRAKVAMQNGKRFFRGCRGRG